MTFTCLLPLCYQTLFFPRLLWDLNEMKKERSFPLSWFILAFFFTSLHTCASMNRWHRRRDAITEPYSRACCTGYQVELLCACWHGYHFSYRLLYFFNCNFHSSGGQWRHHAAFNWTVETVHKRLLISPLIRLPHAYYLLNMRDYSKQAESCWRYKSMGSGGGKGGASRNNITFLQQ